MAKLRRNHKKGERSGFTSLFVRVVLFFIMICGLFIYLYQFLNAPAADGTLSNSAYVPAPVDSNNGSSFLPTSTSGQIIHHKHYSLSYMEEFEQAEWVAYALTKESIRRPNVPRSRRFNEDPQVHTGSATHWDYKGSKMTRGHLAPAGDMAFDKEAMQESFFMSNMSPQKEAFNAGIWRDLEELVRDWAWNEKEILVVTGPVLSDIKSWIGKKTKIAVPNAFYKVILTNNGKKNKAIALIIPHEVKDGSLSKYIVSIDQVEAETGIDFFSEWLPDAEEEQLESIKDGVGWRMVPNRR